jgi:hypothetical protein
VGAENLACTGIQSPNCPAHKVSVLTTPSWATFLEHLQEYFHSLKKNTTPLLRRKKMLEIRLLEAL